MKKYPVNKLQKYELPVVVYTLIGLALMIVIPLVLDAIFR